MAVPSKTEPPEFLLDAIREGAEFTLYRAREHGNPSPILVVAPTAEQPLPQSLRRLEHEYSLAAEVEPAWAAKRLALTRYGGRTILVLADPGGEPLDRILQRDWEQPLDLARLLPLAINLAWRAGEARSRVLRDCKKLTEGAAMNTHETSRESGLIRNGNGALADEQKLVVQAKSGHSSAFGELYERHQLKIYRSVFRILRNEQDAEDAVQQSFQRAFVNLHRFRGDSAFATWMTRIAINEALMMLRRRRVTTPLFETNNNDVNPTSPIDLPDDRPTPEQAFAEKESRAVVAHAISRLRKNLRTVALLRELQGLSNAETARRLGLTVTAVKARTFHARRHLREYLERKCTGPRIDFSRRCIDARIRASSMINNEHHDVIH